MSFVEINGVSVDVRYIYLNVLWTLLLSVVFLPLVVVNLRRLRAASKDSQTEVNVERAKVQWALVTAMVVFPLLVFDVSAVYFDGTRRYRTALEGQQILLGMQAMLSYFFAHLEAFILARKQLLAVPTWFPTAQKCWTIYNLAVGYTLLIITLSYERYYVSGLVQIHWTTQMFVLGPFIVIMSRRTMRQFRDRADFCTVTPKMELALKRFRRKTAKATLILFFLGVVFGSIYVLRPFQYDPSITNLEVRGSRADRAGNFRWDWRAWSALTAMSWIWLFWIPKSKVSDKTAPKSSWKSGRDSHRGSVQSSAPSSQMSMKSTPSSQMSMKPAVDV